MSLLSLLRLGLLLVFACGVDSPVFAAPSAPPTAEASAAPPDPSASAPSPSPADSGPQGADKMPESVPLPPVPASHILDESGMLPETAAQSLSTVLTRLQERTGFRVYLAIHTYLWDETANERSRRLHAAWVDNQGNGIAVVHDRGTGKVSFAGSDDPSFLDPDALRALYRLADASARKLPPEATASDRLVATVSALADGLDLWSRNGQLPAPLPEPEPVSQGPPSLPQTRHVQPPFPVPDTFLVDEAPVFPDEAASRLEQFLRSWHEETGLRLYVVTVTYPPAGLSLPLAEKLRLEWFPDSMGDVIVYDRSRPGTLSFGGSPSGGAGLSPVQLEALHRRTREAALAAGPDPADKLSAAAAFLTAAYSRDALPLFRENRKWLPETPRRVLPWIIAGIGIFFGFLYWIKRWQEHTDRLRRNTFRFPEVYVPERLGAPHGGGISVESVSTVPAGLAPSSPQSRHPVPSAVTPAQPPPLPQPPSLQPALPGS